MDKFLADSLAQLGGRIDALVNNAGIAKVVAAEDERREDFRRVVDVNLGAVFGMSQAVAGSCCGSSPAQS